MATEKSAVESAASNWRSKVAEKGGGSGGEEEATSVAPLMMRM
jgi:hypothetical protein